MSDATLAYDIFARDKGATSTFRKVADSADQVTDKFKDTQTGAKRLADEFAKTKRTVADLRSEFAKSGDMNLLKDIDKQERNLGRLSKRMQEFPRDADGASKSMSLFSRVGVRAGNGVSFFATAATDAGGAVKLLANPIGASVAAVGALAAGALAGGAALAGFGAGLIGLGAIALRSNQRVQKSFTDLGATISGVGARSAQILESDFVVALGKLQQTARETEPALTRMFTNIAPSVTKLATGLGGLAKNALPGLEDASKGANEVLSQLAGELPKTGSAVSSFGTSLAAAAKGGGKALTDVLAVLNEGVRFTGGSIALLGKTYEVASTGAGNLTGMLELLHRSQDDVTDSSRASMVGFSGLAASANMSKAAAEAHERANFDLAASMKNVSSAALSLAGSELASVQANVQMTQTLRENSKTLNINTAAGRTNKQAVLDGVAAAIRYGEAETRRTGNANVGAAAQQRHTDAMYRNAVAVLKDKGAVDSLWRSLGLLPPSKTTRVSVPGAAQATSQIRSLAAATATISRVISIHARVTGASSAIATLNQLSARARAGVAGAGAQGGLVGNLPMKGFAGGGFTGFVRGPGTTTSDSVIARVSNREFVTRASSVAKIGLRNMEYMNRTGTIPSGVVGAGITINGGIHLHPAPGYNVARLIQDIQRHVKSNGPIRGIT